MQLPNDPFMLMSVVNLKLRDYYSNLDEMCEDLQLNKDKLCSKLKKAGFEYNSNLNKFW